MCVGLGRWLLDPLPVLLELDPRDGGVGVNARAGSLCRVVRLTKHCLLQATLAYNKQ